MEKGEMLAFAREHAKSTDLYELLGTDSLKAKDPKEVQRAWRKNSIKYHPDKVVAAGGVFDAEKWQLLERARDVLMDPEARAAYDSARSAILAQEEKRRAMDSKRREMIEDLEARERGEVPKRFRSEERHEMDPAEYQRMLADGNRRLAERRRMMAEAEAREKEKERQADAALDQKIADLETKLAQKKERKAAKAARKAEKVVHEGGGIEDLPAASEAQDEPSKTPKISDPQADEKKVFSAPAPAKVAAAAAATPQKFDFSATKARLKAAQAAKEQRGR